MAFQAFVQFVPISTGYIAPVSHLQGFNTRIYNAYAAQNFPLKCTQIFSIFWWTCCNVVQTWGLSRAFVSCFESLESLITFWILVTKTFVCSNSHFLCIAQRVHQLSTLILYLVWEFICTGVPAFMPMHTCLWRTMDFLEEFASKTLEQDNHTEYVSKSCRKYSGLLCNPYPSLCHWNIEAVQKFP